MPLSFSAFFTQLPENPALLLTTVLLLGVLLVNGWTDAPNAISAAVVTGALPFPPGGAAGGWVQPAAGYCASPRSAPQWPRRCIPSPASEAARKLPLPPCAPPWRPLCCGRCWLGASASPPAKATLWWRESPEPPPPWRETCPASTGWAGPRSWAGPWSVHSGGLLGGRGRAAGGSIM